LVSLFSYPLSTIGEFLWDGLAFIRRNDEHFINEPHVGNAPKKLRFEGKPRAQRSARRARKGPRGNPIASSKGTSYFNDALGTTIGAKKDGKYSAAALTAFGERLDNVDSTSPAIRSLGEGWFTGKPFVEGLGHAFLMRNYRAGLAKWQSADPMGYPDGWNQLAYCGNGVIGAVDLWGCRQVDLNKEILFGDQKPLRYEKYGEPYWDYDYLGNKHKYQDYGVYDDNQYVKLYRNTKEVYVSEWVHSIALGLTEAGAITMAVATAAAALPDPFPLTKVGELSYAATLSVVAATTWIIGKVTEWLFDDKIEVWDGEEYMGKPYKHANVDKNGRPYLILPRIIE
jgi:RHS repeat-associated protein